MNEIVTTRVQFDINKCETGRYVCRRVTSDIVGRVLDDSEFDKSGNILHQLIYRYSKNGNVSEYIENNAREELVERHVHVEDEEGLIIKSVFEYADGKKVVKNFAFTELGLADRATMTDEEGNFIGYETYVLDSKGNVISEIETDDNNVELSRYGKTFSEGNLLTAERKYVDGHLLQIERFDYDREDRLTIITIEDETGQMSRKEEYKFNYQGNIVFKCINDFVQDEETIEEYHFDEAGNMIQNKVFYDGRLVFENKCAYSENNFLISEEIMEIDGRGIIAKHEKLVHQLSSPTTH